MANDGELNQPRLLATRGIVYTQLTASLRMTLSVIAAKVACYADYSLLNGEYQLCSRQKLCHHMQCQVVDNVIGLNGC
jgi:hypothetical protein